VSGSANVLPLAGATHSLPATMILVKILHAVSGILAAFHAVGAMLLSMYWEHTQPRHYDPASGATVRWESTDDGVTTVFYVTPRDDAVWDAAIIVALVCGLVCAGLTLVLKLDARRNGRTTIY
jgi:hypothetical protein